MIRAEDVPLVPPAWLELLERAEERHPEADRAAPGVTVDDPANVDRAGRFLEETEPAVEGRGGNNHTYATAAVLRSRFALSQDTAERLMHDEFNPRCRPPWAPDELATIVENTYRYAKRPIGHDAPRSDPFEGVEAAGDRHVAPDDEDGWPFFNVDEVRRMPPVSWLVKGTLPERALALLYGPMGSYKSFLMLDVALHVAMGWDWCGHRVQRPYRVAYIAGEGISGLGRRVRAWEIAHETEVPSDRFILAKGMPMFSETGDLKKLAVSLRRFGAEFVPVDTAARAMAGLDENSAQDVGVFVARCDELVQQLGLSVALVHHTGKDVGKGSRGSTALPAAADVMLEADKPAAGQLAVEMRKQKDAEVWPRPLLFETEEVVVGEDGDGDPLRSLVLRRSNRTAVNAREAERERWAAEAKAELDSRLGARLSNKDLRDAVLTRLELHEQVGRRPAAGSVSARLHDYLRRAPGVHGHGLSKVYPDYVREWREGDPTKAPVYWGAPPQNEEEDDG